MNIGIDFDNTIINYDHVFYKYALKKKFIKTHFPKNKTLIKDKIIKDFNEREWTKLQGVVYTEGLKYAKLYDGCLNALKKIDQKGHKLMIISHKTKYPVIGKKINLHEKTLNWINENIFEKRKFIDFKLDDIYFNQTKKDKINKVIEKKCNVFIDDLEVILNSLPNSIVKILFTKDYKFNSRNKLIHIGNWHSLLSLSNVFQK